MRSRHELKQSLLSSSANFIQDKEPQTEETGQNLRRLKRKIVMELPQNKITKPQVLLQGPFCGKVFNPNSKIIIGWYVINILLTYLYFIEIPIAIAFDRIDRTAGTDEKENQNFLQLINFPVMTIFLMDIIINFNTSFYEDGELQTDPAKIKVHYLVSSFVFDLLSLVAIFIFEVATILNEEYAYDFLKYVLVIFCVRFQKVAKLQKAVLISFDLHRRAKALFKLILLLIKIMFVCNLVASGGYLISDYLSSNVKIYNSDRKECGPPCYWITNTSQGDIVLKNQTFNVKYVYSLYWASTTMISIGYGDITPKNSYEVTYTVIIQFLSCLLYAYAINEIWNIMLELNRKKTRINARLNTINLYMRDKEIGPQLNSKVNGYLTNYYYAKNLREKQVQDEIIAELTPALKKQLFFESYSILFNQQYFISMNDKVIMSACQSVKQVCCYEDETLSPRDFSPSPCLFYLKKGELLQYYGGLAKIKIRSQYKGDYIGLYQFITQQSFLSKLTAVQYSLAYYIKYCYWRNALLEERGCFQYFYLTKESMMLYHQLGRIGHLCYFCSMQNHRTQFCFSYKLRSQVLKSYQQGKKSQDQHRKPQFARRKLKIKIGGKKSVKKSFTNKVISQIFYSKKELTDQSSLMPQMNLDDLKHQRKWSELEQFQVQRGGKMIVKQKFKHENVIIQNVREHHANKSEESSQYQQLSEQIKLREIEIDVLAHYEEYYPKFNCSQLNPRQARKKLSRSFFH